MTNSIRNSALLIALSVVLGILGCPEPVSAPPDCPSRPGRAEPARPVEPFHFVQISDMHFNGEENFSRARRMVQWINVLPMKIEFVVITGDITSDMIEHQETVARAKAILRELRVPVHYVAGNHDILQSNLEPTLDAYRRHFGELLTTAVHRGVKFVFIYTEPLAEHFTVLGYDPLVQLKDQLTDAGTMPVIICHHRPSIEDFYMNEMQPGWPVHKQRRWEHLINSHNVKAVLAGHFHKDEQHWLGNVPLYIAPPMSDDFGRQATFRIYEYRNGKLSYRTQYL